VTGGADAFAAAPDARYWPGMAWIPDSARTFLGGFLTTLLFVAVVVLGLGGVFLLVHYLAGPVGG
jgi:hypothetical protein